MKKIFCMFLAAIVTLCLFGCDIPPEATVPTKETGSTQPPENPTHTPTEPTKEIETIPPTEAPTEAPTEPTPSVQLSYEIYLPNENADGFIVETVNVAQITADGVLAELKAKGVLPETVGINAFQIAGSQINVDFNQDFGKLVCSTGTSGELMIVGSVVNTFLNAFQGESLYFTVDGRILESGHVVYDFPQSFVDLNPTNP